MELVLYLLIGKILKNRGFFDDYDRFADELVNLPLLSFPVGKNADEMARAYALKHKDDPYQIWIGSGNLWPHVFVCHVCARGVPMAAHQIRYIA